MTNLQYIYTTRQSNNLIASLFVLCHTSTLLTAVIVSRPMKVSLFVLALLPAVVLATLGVDISQPTSQAAFSCMKNNGKLRHNRSECSKIIEGNGMNASIGYSFAVARVHMSTGHVDPNGPATIGHAWAAGMAHVDGCRHDPVSRYW